MSVSCSGLSKPTQGFCYTTFRVVYAPKATFNIETAVETFAHNANPAGKRNESTFLLTPPRIRANACASPWSTFAGGGTVHPFYTERRRCKNLARCGTYLSGRLYNDASATLPYWRFEKFCLETILRHLYCVRFVTSSCNNYALPFACC